MTKITEKQSFWYGTTFIFILIIVGLICFIISTIWGGHEVTQAVSETKIQIQFLEENKFIKFIDKIGEAFLIAGIFHGIFEFIIKPKLFDEITEHTTKVFKDNFIEEFKQESLKGELFEFISDKLIRNDRISSCGLVDYIESSKSINYAEIIKSPEKLIIGLNHSYRLIGDNLGAFLERAKAGKKTSILTLKVEEPSAAGIYEKAQYDYSDEIKIRLKRIEDAVKEIKSNVSDDIIELKEHDVVLRYSFVYTESFIWIKPYRSSKGRKIIIPVLVLKSHSSLYNFYEADIHSLLEQSAVKVLNK